MTTEETAVTIIVTPIDPAAKGSRRQRRELFAINRAALEAQAKALADTATPADNLALLDALDAAESAFLPYLRTSDGSPLADALEDVSIDDFNALTRAVMGGGTASVPPENTIS